MSESAPRHANERRCSKTSCASPIPLEAKFCPACGSAVLAELTPEMYGAMRVEVEREVSDALIRKVGDRKLVELETTERVKAAIWDWVRLGTVLVGLVTGAIAVVGIRLSGSFDQIDKDQKAVARRVERFNERLQ